MLNSWPSSAKSRPAFERLRCSTIQGDMDAKQEPRPELSSRPLRNCLSCTASSDDPGALLHGTGLQSSQGPTLMPSRIDLGIDHVQRALVGQDAGDLFTTPAWHLRYGRR